MSKAFVMFREGRRLRAAHAQLSRPDAPILIGGHRFAPAGALVHWSHLTDAKKRLVGFVVDSVDRANSTGQWRAWWDSFDNRELIEFYLGYLLLADPMPKDYHEDGALLVGGDIYSEGRGEFALAIPDKNGMCFQTAEPVEFWNGLGFELAQVDIGSVD